VTSYIIHIRCR